VASLVATLMERYVHLRSSAQCGVVRTLLAQSESRMHMTSTKRIDYWDGLGSWPDRPRLDAGCGTYGKKQWSRPGDEVVFPTLTTILVKQNAKTTTKPTHPS
jgi:hypothetical protein